MKANIFHHSSSSLFILFTFLLVNACSIQEVDPTLPQSTSMAINARVEKEESFPIFKSMREMKETAFQLEKDSLKAAQFEKKYKFKSLQGLYNSLKKLKKNGVTSVIYQSYLQEYPNSFLTQPDGEISINLFTSLYANVVNENGLVGVAGHILQYTQEYVKVLIGGNHTKITLLKNAQKDMPEHGILLNLLNLIYKTKVVLG